MKSTHVTVILASVLLIAPVALSLQGHAGPGIEESSSTTPAKAPSHGLLDEGTLPDAVDKLPDPKTLSTPNEHLSYIEDILELRKALIDADTADGVEAARHAQLANLDRATHAVNVAERIDALPEPSTPLERLDHLEALLELRGELVTEPATPTYEAGLDAQTENLELARDLVTMNKQASALEDPIAQTVHAAKALARIQADRLGIPWTDTTAPTPSHELPSEAIQTLVHQQGGTLTNQDLDAARELDTLPTQVRDALTRTIDAYAGFASAAQQAYHDADVSALETTTLSPSATTAQALTTAGIDINALTDVLSARNDLLDAASELATSVEDTPELAQPSATPSSTLDLPPYISIDMDGEDDTYLENFHLLIEIGGSDTYLNNAGGTGIGNCDLNTFAAALIDLDDTAQATEQDHYNARRNNGDWRQDACGKNGGTNGPGAGFLFNTGSSDVYGEDDRTNPTHGFTDGVNGGATTTGLGLLVDTDGDDTYSADARGVNGGGHNAGIGALVDGIGTDAYLGTTDGVNGAGANAGTGTLVDLIGFDDYLGETRGVNGGANGTAASGLLYDGTGDDTYTTDWPHDFGINGGANDHARGFLLDTGLGDDTYTAEAVGTNGGAANGAIGFLADLEPEGVLSSTTIQATHTGTNGGAYNASAGLLATRGPATATHTATNGGATTGPLGPSAGVLVGAVDATATHTGTNGGANGQASVGTALELTGSLSADSAGTNGGASGAGANAFLLGTGASSYTAGNTGTNGGAAHGGSALLIDANPTTATDYTAGDTGTNGGASTPGSTGLLIDSGASAGSTETFTAGDEGTNGGGYLTGSGALVHLDSATTTYNAGSFSTNGGGSTQGSGLLLDVGGQTSYLASHVGTNGGGQLGGFGALIDLGGADDIYDSGDDGTNGGAAAGGIGLHLDDAGDDDYDAGDTGTNGAGQFGGVGAVVNLAGNDDYTAATGSTNGAGTSGGIGLLLDAQGQDSYTEGSSMCSDPADCSEVPRGSTGAKIDI